MKLLLPWFLLGTVCIASAQDKAVPGATANQQEKPSSTPGEVPDSPWAKFRKTDEIGARIQTEADARAYAAGFIDTWAGNEKDLPSITPLKGRLSRAEFAALHDAQKLIPESRVARTFNALAHRWRAPKESRITAEEFHAFRVFYALALYPRSVPRAADGSIGPGCRPTEALFLLSLLDSQGGPPAGIREKVKAGYYPEHLPKTVNLQEHNQNSRLVAMQPGTVPPEEVVAMRRGAAYWNARHWYLTRHPQFNAQKQITRLLDELKIPKNGS